MSEATEMHTTPRGTLLLRQILEGVVHLHEIARLVHKNLADFGLADRKSHASELRDEECCFVEDDILCTGQLSFKLLREVTSYWLDNVRTMSTAEVITEIENLKGVPIEAKNLISQMVQDDRKARRTAREALNAPMFACPDNFVPRELNVLRKKSAKLV